MIDPYLDRDGRPTTNRGIDFIDAEPLREYVTRLDAAGLQAHFHAIGDRAVRVALDAIEAARPANGMTDTRPHIAHIQVIHPDDVPRFAPLGAVANAQPLWACHETQMDELTIPFLGPERATLAVPVRVVAASGRATGDGLRLERLDAQSAPRDRGRRRPGLTRTRARRPGRSCRTSG